MQVELARLEDTGGGFAHAYAPGELVLNDDRVRLTGAPQVSGRINRQRNKVLVDGRLTATVEIDCDRCLKPVALTIQPKFTVEYITAEAYMALEVSELDNADLALSVFDGEALNIDDIVLEQLLLAIPSQAICREQCKGLCSICGADRNVSDCDCKPTEIDPRWAGLKELVNDE